MRMTTTYAYAIRYPSNQDRTHQVQELHTINICNRTQASNHPSNRREQYASVSDHHKMQDFQMEEHQINTTEIISDYCIKII